MKPARHIMTVDVERWFDGVPGLQGAESLPSDLPGNIDRVLELFELHDVEATFFWLGALAAEFPDLVRKMADAGHEIGCHGWSHDPLDKLGPGVFREQTGQALDSISSVTGSRVESYRAPFFSVDESSFWAMDTLAELGIKYDSSILPSWSWRYGYPAFPQGISRVKTLSGDITEVPVSTYNCRIGRIATGGGAWFRILPYRLTESCFQGLSKRGEPGVFYFHTWELDPNPPLRFFEPRSWFCHYTGLRSAGRKLGSFLEHYNFTSLVSYMETGGESDGT